MVRCLILMILLAFSGMAISQARMDDELLGILAGPMVAFPGMCWRTPKQRDRK